MLVLIKSYYKITKFYCKEPVSPQHYLTIIFFMITSAFVTNLYKQYKSERLLTHTHNNYNTLIVSVIFAKSKPKVSNLFYYFWHSTRNVVK